MIRSLSDPHVPSIGYVLRHLRQAGAALRERLSHEHWSFIKDAEDRFKTDCGELLTHPPSGSDAIRALMHSSSALACITGAQNDRMWRDDGWCLLFVGRQIERLTTLANALLLGLNTKAVHDAAGFAVALDLFDSTISFHARYQRSSELQALIEHVVTNQQNPRSLALVTQDLNNRLQHLHRHDRSGAEDLSLRLRILNSEDLPAFFETSNAGVLSPLQAYLSQSIESSNDLSQQIGLRHFTHTGEVRQSV